MKNFYKNNMKNIKKHKNLDNSVEKNTQNNFLIKNSPIEIGMEHGSYLAGFGLALSHLNLSEESIATIVEAKINLEYQQEIARMKFQTDEKIAEIYSSAGTHYYEE